MTPIYTMTDNRQPYLPLGDIVLPQVDPTPQLVNEVMNCFGFERVQTAMPALGWTYFDETESPSLETLRATARGLLNTVAEEKEPFVEHQTGGFRACWYPTGTVTLTFVLEFGYSRKKSGARLLDRTAVR